MKNELFRQVFPFSAIVGQEEMKRALLLCAIDPGIGGVLIRGEKGTAKSTAVRALAGLLGERQETEGCRFHCDPEDEAHMCAECRAGKKRSAVTGRMKVVELPLGATEDRVVGTMDIEAALKRGEQRFEPGILADANRNILYVDEVNLLDDHIVDVLLDAAAMGVNVIEREGISFSHPSRFVLVGTMNPEEGELRPQLTDRFGLSAEVSGEKDADARREVVRRRLEYERDPEAFCRRWEPEQTAVREMILQARKRLPEVTWSEKCLALAVDIALSVEAEGHRADITLMKTAAANAALGGRMSVAGEDMLTAASLSLCHRLRRRPFEEGTVDMEAVGEMIKSYGEI